MSKNMSNLLCFYWLLLSLWVFLQLGGCKYSLSGASVAPDIKTIHIQQFTNGAPIVVPSLAQNFTDMLRQKFLSQTNLSLTSTQGHLQLSGSISGYSITPMAVQNDGAVNNRLTITVMVEFVNEKYPEQSWNQSFSNFADFNATQNFASVEGVLIQEINEKLTQDIFNKALANW